MMEDFYSQKGRQSQSNTFLAKCFRCTGTNQSNECTECRGSSLISSQHPLAILLSNVLQKSLQNSADNKYKHFENQSGNFFKKDESPLLPHRCIDRQSQDQCELRDTQMQTISQQFEDQTSERMQAFEEEESNFRLNRKNSSIANYFEQQRSQRNGQSSPPDSVIRLEIEGLFSCFDTNCSAIVSKEKIKKISSKNQIDKENMNIAMFADYRCDCCESQPIQGARYHCRTCLDFDVCEKCYEQGEFVHQHARFDRVDPTISRQQQQQQLREKIALQRTRLKARKL